MKPSIGFLLLLSHAVETRPHNARARDPTSSSPTLSSESCMVRSPIPLNPSRAPMDTFRMIRTPPCPARNLPRVNRSRTRSALTRFPSLVCAGYGAQSRSRAVEASRHCPGRLRHVPRRAYLRTKHYLHHVYFQKYLTKISRFY